MLLTTYRCNLTCDFCFYEKEGMYNHFRTKDKRKEMTVDEFIDLVVNPLLTMGLKKVTLSGGEPLIKKDIVKLIKHIIGLDLDCRIQSNLTVNVDTILNDEEILRNISLQTSIDGVREDHDLYRGAGSYDKTVNNLRRAIDFYNALNMIPSVHVNTVLTKQNIFKLIQHVEDMIECGVRSLSFQHLTWDGPQSPNPLTREQIGELLKVAHEAKKIALANGMKLKFFPFDVSSDRMDDLDTWYNTSKFLQWKGCDYIKTKLRVNSFGDVFSCIEEAVGNLKDNSMGEILSGTNYNDFKNYILNCGPRKECKRCCNLKTSV